MPNTSREARIIRHERVRKNMIGIASRPRLAVFRSSEHIYAQVIDDTVGNTLVSASTLDAEVKAQKDASMSKIQQAAIVGEFIAKRAIAKGINKVVFDRGGNKYHGRVKALADGARSAGLEF